MTTLSARALILLLLMTTALRAQVPDAWHRPEPTVPSSHGVPPGNTSVWTGSEVMVFGGGNDYTILPNNPWGFTPAADTWTAVNIDPTFGGRKAHTAVWTGSEMIVWGGYDFVNQRGVWFWRELNDGGRYAPSSNTWSAVTTTGAPNPRRDHSAVWTGTEMIIWGGRSSPAQPISSLYRDDGARYAPATNSWTAMTTIGAPWRRYGHTAVWTGSEMIVWGGGDYGARYRPATDTWAAVNPTGGPSPRYGHTAVWTGTEMIVWGGGGNDGARYSPATDTWAAVTLLGAPAARAGHIAAWTGSEMIVWGGSNGLKTGGRYNPSTDSWTAMTTDGTGPVSGSTAVWTGSELIVPGPSGAYSYTPGSPAELAITSAVHDNGTLTLSFPSVTGLTYTLWRSDTLASGSWTDSGLTAVAGTGASLSFTVPATAPARRFFMVEATDRPLILGNGQVVTQPASGEVVVGQSAGFAVTALGEGLTYQWFKNDLAISGATSAGYAIANARISDFGNYSVMVTNAAGLAKSQNVLFLITEPAGFARIEAKTFTLGSPDSEPGRFVDEGPQSTVTISQGFYLKDTEVSWAEWNAVRGQAAANGYSDLAVGRNGKTGDASGSHPVTEVNWWDAIKWCNLRSQIEGRTPVYYTAAQFGASTVFKVGEPVVYADWSAKGYRLPTEAEWEFACRAGTTGPTYADLNLAGWYVANSSANTHPVGQKLANGWAVKDMYGNVWEWCWDWKDGYTSAAKTDPRGAATGTDRVIRGGSWQDLAETCRSAFRNVGGSPGGRFPFLGFRPVLSVVPTTQTPVVIAQPVGQTVSEGHPASLSVTATGGGLSYQWYKYDSPLPGATDRVLTITAAGVGDAGNYLVTASNAAGSTTSQPAALVVNAVPLMGFAKITNGSFTLGSPADEPGRFDDEGPQSTATISRDFFLKETEVTWTEWKAVRELAMAYGYSDIAVGRNGNNGDAAGAHPVTEVSWWDVLKWCNLKSQRTGRTPVYYTAAGFGPTTILKAGTPTVHADWSANGYRLPTEAEWEFACRAGTAGATYADIEAAGWYLGNSGNNTHPAGQKLANAWGLKDMHGNAWEWCWDGLDAYTTAAKTDPRGAATASTRILRGGGWNASQQNCRSATRGNQLPEFRLNVVGFRPALDSAPPLAGFSYIQEGSFQMGDQSNPLVGRPEERPVHAVFVGGFYIGQTEVTSAQWEEVRTWGVSHGYTDLPPGGALFKAPNHPVLQIDWYSMVKWCNARSERESLMPCYTVSGAVYRTGSSEPDCHWTANGFRLPTEAEWEKAARGGLSAQNFPWGNTISHSQANYYSDGFQSYDVSPTRYFHPTYKDGLQSTSPVGSFAPNGYGLHDMAGNAQESCWDFYEGVYSAAPQTNPRGPVSGSGRVTRGGSWDSPAQFTRIASRRQGRTYKNESEGFRLARSRP